MKLIATEESPLLFVGSMYIDCVPSTKIIIQYSLPRMPWFVTWLKLYSLQVPG